MWAVILWHCGINKMIYGMSGMTGLIACEKSNDCIVDHEVIDEICSQTL